MKFKISILPIAPLVLTLNTWLALPDTAHCFYNPATGRWLSRDPIGEHGGATTRVFPPPVSSEEHFGTNGAIRPQSYTDPAGIPFPLGVRLPPGSLVVLKLDAHWDVTFRCFSSDGRTPPVARHDTFDDSAHVYVDDTGVHEGNPLPIPLPPWWKRTPVP